MLKSVNLILSALMLFLIMVIAINASGLTPLKPELLKENSFEAMTPGGEQNKVYYIGDFCTPAAYWRFPNSLGRNHFAQRFDLPSGDTLEGIWVLMYYDGGVWGTPDMRITVWGDLGGKPDSTNPIYSAVIQNDSIYYYPSFTPHYVSGSVIVPSKFHVSVTLSGAEPGDTLSIMSDDESYCGDNRSTYSPNGSDWFYTSNIYPDKDVNFCVYVKLSSNYEGPTWYVSPSGNDAYDGTRMGPFKHIQNAVDASSTGDTIVILPGIYTGPGNRVIDLGTKNLVIRGEAGADLTIMDVNSGGNGFNITMGQFASTVIEGLRITDANRAINLQGTSPIIRNMTLDSNQYGIYSYTTGPSPVCENSIFYENITGIYSDGIDYNSFSIDSSTFTLNQTAVEGDFYIMNSVIQDGLDGLVTNGEGPAGYQFRADNCFFTGMYGKVLEVGFHSELNNCRIQNNTANYIAYGQSIGSTYLRPTFNNCEIDNNSSGMYFTGADVYLTMYNTRYSNNGDKINFSCNYRGDVDIDSTVFISNDTVPLAITALEADVSIINSSFLKNNGEGLRLYTEEGDVQIISSTFAQNVYGIYISDVQNGFSLDSSILAYNDFGIYANEIGFPTIGCNNAYNEINYGGSMIDYTGSNGNISLDPQFCDTSEDNYHLNETSPCAPANNGCSALMGAYDVGCFELRPMIVIAFPNPLAKTGCPSNINIKVTDPENYHIGYNALGNFNQTLFPADYIEEGPPDCEEIVQIHYPIPGEYTIEVFADGTPEGTYSIGILIDGSNLCMQAENQDVPASGADTYVYIVEDGYHYLNGDANRSDNINILDVTFLITYLYKGGPEPDPLYAGDANCNLAVNILDITYLINYLYKGGPPPCNVTE